MEKLGKKEEAIQSLDQLIQRYPENKMLQWVKAKFMASDPAILDAGAKNATVRILEQLSEMP